MLPSGVPLNSREAGRGDLTLSKLADTLPLSALNRTFPHLLTSTLIRFHHVFPFKP